MGIGIKIRLIQLGLTQRWLTQKLQERGFKTLRPTHVCSIINHPYSRFSVGTTRQVLDAMDTILCEEEHRRKRDYRVQAY